MYLEINFSNETENTELESYFPTVQALYEYTLKHTGNDKMYEVSISIVDEKMIQNINREYRNKDAVTDVISFAFLDDTDIQYPDDMPIPLGEIYICDKRMYEQAEDYGHGVNREFHFLALHGLLHLLGYDHMNEADETVMFNLQEEILTTLGYERVDYNG